MPSLLLFRHGCSKNKKTAPLSSHFLPTITSLISPGSVFSPRGDPVAVGRAQLFTQDARTRVKQMKRKHL